MNIDTEFGTYLITQESLSAGRTTREVVAAAVEAGIDVVQVREKDRGAREQLRITREVVETTHGTDVTVLVNDRVSVAVAADADGVHLGDDDLPVPEARSQLGADAIVGRSVSSVEGAKAAADAGVDYLGVGALYRTSTKDVDDEEAELGLDVVRSVAAAVDVPFVGVGGVTPENAADVVAAGADGVAVVSAITAAEDPTVATRDLTEAVAEGRRRRGEGTEVGR
jgi:thiamine-phosphate pyrophosphorylase